MQRIHNQRRSRPRGFTLIEVMIAMVIATFVSISFMGSIIYLLRQNADNRKHMTAVNIASYYQGLLFAADPRKVGDTNLTDADFEKQFDYDEANPLFVYENPAKPHEKEKLKVYFRYTGFGAVKSATETTLKADFADNQDPWITDEWAGGYVTVNKVGDKAKAQVMRIVSNSSDTLTVTSDLTGEVTDEEWQTIPTDEYIYHINNSRTVVVTIEWGDGEGYRKIVRSVILARGQQ